MTENRSAVIEEQESSSVIEEEDALEYELFELVRLGTLVRGIIHNLSTPLSGVVGGIQLLEMRIAAVQDGIEKLKDPSKTSWQELLGHLERNKKNLDLVSRNARNLAELVQNFVERINRFSVKVPDIYSLNHLVQMELRFLESNLTFKHRVRKSVQLADDLPPIKCSFAVFAKTLDEIVYTAMECHEPGKKKLLEINLCTQTHSQQVALTMDCSIEYSVFEKHFSLVSPSGVSRPSIEQCFNDMREDGWETEMRRSSLGTVFEFRHAPVRLASEK
jgi:hypothetical protein